MVNNFQDQFCPKAIAVPPGKALIFKKQMEKLVEGVKSELSGAFESKSYLKRIDEIKKKYGEQQRRIFAALDEEAKQKGLAINRTQSGFQTFPLADGQPMSREAFEALGDEEKKRIEADIHEIQSKIESSLRDVAKTAPYFHDGSAETLEQAVALMAGGGKDNPDLSAMMKTVRSAGLTEQDQKDIVAFLTGLSGDYPVVEPPDLP